MRLSFRRDSTSTPESDATSRPVSRETANACYSVVREEDPLESLRRVWRTERMAQQREPRLLDGRWEQEVMRAVRACSIPEPDVVHWLARCLFPLSLANAAVLLLSLGAVWRTLSAADALSLLDYLQASLPGYGALL